MSEIWRDIRLAARLLVHQRGFAFIVIFTLAVGLAANATVMALIDGLVLRPFPLRDIDRLVQVYGVNPAGGPFSERAQVSPADFADWQRESRVAKTLVALQWWDATVAGGTEPERIQGFRVSPAFFDALGVGVSAGRGFLGEEGQPGRDRVAVISQALWARRFGRDPGVVGRTIQLEDTPHVVVGIAPEKFDYPFGAEVWAPLAFGADALERRDNRYLQVVGRLRDGARPAELQAEMSAITGRLAKAYPDTNRGWTVNTMSLAESVTDIGAIAFLAVHQVATLLVLLLACVNVANLMLVRAADRNKELALRLAMGASRWRIIRLLAIESLSLAVLGALLAIPLAWAALQACRAAMPPNIARFVRGWNDIGVDLRVVGALAILAVASTVVFGLLPAIRASRVTLTQALNAGARTGGSGRHRLRNTMVVVEVAMALTLLVAAGLSVRGTATVLWRDDGYDPDRVMTMRVSLLGARYDTPDKQRAFFEQLVADAQGTLGVEDAAVTNVVPSTTRNASSGLEIDGRPVADPAQRPGADFRTVTPGYFKALKIGLLGGRDFSALDTKDSARVAIVSETMARRYWPGEDPIGKRFKVGPAYDQWHTVVGLARDVRHGWFLDFIAPTYYVPFAQSPADDMVLVMRGTGDPAPLAQAGRTLVLQRDAGQPVYEVRSLRDARWEGATGLKFAAAFMGAFGLIGLLLAGVGIYAILAYAVRQRTHEIGVRIALGASRREVIGTTLGRGMMLTGIGLAIGLAGAYALGAAMERLLFGSIRLDVMTFVVFTAVLALAALAASIVPARRAMRVDPIVALRTQ